MQVWGCTDVGQVRENNQDSFYIEITDDGNALCVVCDGMGGAKAGNVASRLAADSFIEHSKSVMRPGIKCENIKEIMCDSLSAANQSVNDMAELDEFYNGMGTTLVAAISAQDDVVIINVGDSRAYLINKEGIERITRDHSVVEDMVEMGELTAEEAKEHPGKNLITRAVGTDENVVGDIYTISAEKGSYILLCTDGLTNLVSDQEILYEVLYGGEASVCCERLIAIANTRGGYDNITAVLLAI